MASDADPDAALHRLIDVYRTHERRVLSVCLDYLHERAAAEDAAQETFLRAAPHLGRLEDHELGAYLATAARNVCINELRSRRRGERTADALRVVDAVLDPEASVLDRRAVRRVWSGLPPRDRALLFYRFAGYSYVEIAVRLRLSVNTVRVALLRARRRARGLMEQLPGAVAAWVWRRRSARRLRPHAAMTLGAPPLLSTAAIVGGVACAIAVPLSAQGRWWRPAAAPVPSAGVTVPWSGGGDYISAVAFTSVAASPDYRRDRTLYAAGDVVGCGAPPCHLLYRSSDGGRSWGRLAADDFAGGQVLPASGRLFAAGPSGLQRSDDGGRSFRTVVDVVGPAAVVPGSDTVVVAGARLLLYDPVRNTSTAGAALPRGAAATDAAFGDGGDLLVTAGAGGAQQPAPAVLLRCSLRGGCRTVLAPAGVVALRLVRSSTFAVDHTLALVSVERAWLSTDGGRTFHEQVGTSRDLRALGLGADAAGRLRVVTATGGGGDTVLTISGPAPAPARSAHGGDAPQRPRLLLVLPDGLVVAAPGVADGAQRWGLRCSFDGGLTWVAA